MFWYDHEVSGWGWFVMSVSMVLFWALLITLCVLLFRALARPDTSRETRAGFPVPGPTPEQLLAERFARGEIDEREYERALAVLRAGGGPPPTKGST